MTNDSIYNCDKLYYKATKWPPSQHSTLLLGQTTHLLKFASWPTKHFTKLFSYNLQFFFTTYDPNRYSFYHKKKLLIIGITCIVIKNSIVSLVSQTLFALVCLKVTQKVGNNLLGGQISRNTTYTMHGCFLKVLTHWGQFVHSKDVSYFVLLKCILVVIKKSYNLTIYLIFFKTFLHTLTIFANFWGLNFQNWHFFCAWKSTLRRFVINTGLIQKVLKANLIFGHYIIYCLLFFSF